MKGIYVFFADGFEDIEALAPVDVLRRAGLEVTLVSIAPDCTAVSSHGVQIRTDLSLSDLEISHEGTSASDFLIFPGGMPGSKSLSDCEPLISLMQAHYDNGGSLAAICAAPGLVLSRLEGISGKRFTCYDGFQDRAIAAGGIFDPQPAVADGRIVTGRGAGYALVFAEKILSCISPSALAKVHAGMFLE